MYESKEITSLPKKNYELFCKVMINSSDFSKFITKLQQEYIDAWKNVVRCTILLGCDANVTNIIQEHIEQMMDASGQAYIYQNKITKCTEIATKHIFETFNENTKSFASLNEEIMEYLMSMFEQKQK